MSKLEDFLSQRVDEAFLNSDDVVHAILPLIKQLIKTHESDQVGPLEGIHAINIEQAGIWFAVKDTFSQRISQSKLRHIDPVNKSALNVVSETSVVNHLNDNEDEFNDHVIVEREIAFKSPVYLPGYICWEQQLNHHDPLCDIFVTGLILASLACNLNFNNIDDLKLFVENRNNLFNINPDLDPVIAKAIVQTTEVSRHSRMADLNSLYRLLKNYRDQETDIDFELLKVSNFESKQLNDKQQIILSKLQERLFEVSRRNKLLHFKPTQQTINLTQASVPLSCDIENIKADSLLTWTHSFKSDVLKEKPIQLNKYVNINEALYLPGVFDKLRSEANRDQKEFGFAQLRLVLCFLAWTNLKDSNKERFFSPLVLLPVSLTKKKGVKDKYWLEVIDTEAEINPVIRHQFSELFDIKLPETIDLKKTDLTELHKWLEAKIESSDKSITLDLIDKPKVDIIHEAAKRRLDHYNRRAGLSGRSVLKYDDIDYSYNIKNLHPLGLRLFNQRVRIEKTQLQRIVGDIDSADVQYMVDTQTSNKPSIIEKKQAFYSIREDDEDNPYRWQFDMCNITLGNFKYRKMSLVKDYASLIESPLENKAFEATFSLNPRDILNKEIKPTKLNDRYHVVACDPTQAEAISLAKQGESYIIQGPPGTGKSQTITNLIADYIARDKKILFVCEKRAAIDIVYLRLKQQGLGSICSLIHDSQADKKNFIMDLKATYESFIDYGAKTTPTDQPSRDNLVAQLKKNIEPIREFDEFLTKKYASSGITLNKLLTFTIENKKYLPDFTELELEFFPDYCDWESNRESINKLTETLKDIQPDGVLANHPLALLHEDFLALEQPMNRASTLINNATEYLRDLSNALINANNKANLASNCFLTIGDIQHLLNYLNVMAILSNAKLTCLFNPSHTTTQKFSVAHKKYLKKVDKFNKTQEKTQHWQQKLPIDDVENALIQAKSYNGFLSFLSPNWWKLRKILNSHYNFSAHKIKPKWEQVLSWLLEEHKAQATVLDFVDDMQIEFGFEYDLNEIDNAIEDIKAILNKSNTTLLNLHELLINNDSASEIVDTYLNMNNQFNSANNDLIQLLQSYENIGLADLLTILNNMNKSLDQLPEYLLCLKHLSTLPTSLVSIYRQYKINSKQIEIAIAHKTVSHIIKSQPQLNRMVSSVKQQYVRNMGEHHNALYKQNSISILSKVRDNFLHNMNITNLPAAKLNEEQKYFKKTYNKGRRELEHEFGKTIRFKSIRDMVAKQSGIVINDLKRVWLMSPLSVSDTLPLNDKDFDVVIFDEASQITLEEAIPSIFRSHQSIVVGDQMQLPPTNFFSAKSTSSDDDSLEFYEDNEIVEYDLNSNSFLSHVSNNLVSRRLGWHYRSRSESLISFSNWAFYQGSLLTVPDVIANTESKPPINVTDITQGDQNINSLLSRAVSFHWLENGTYESRRNRDEADYIARLVRSLLLSKDQKSIGIVAFSEAQQSEIEKALNKLAEDDRIFRNLLEEEYEREKDGEFVGLLVKNLENIQGDERDIIILSVCYGYNKQKKMRMHFGPINQKGGEKRLNVAFSRAKQHMVVISSIQYSDITNEYNEGANALKTYLHYAEAISIGDEEAANRILYGLSYTDPSEKNEHNLSLNHPVLIQIKKALIKEGWLVDIGVGHSRFKCDLAIRKSGAEKYSLGLFLDTENHYKQLDIIERDLLKPQLLRNFGWNIINLLSKDWYDNPEATLNKILTILENKEISEDDNIEPDAIMPVDKGPLLTIENEPSSKIHSEMTVTESETSNPIENTHAVILEDSQKEEIILPEGNSISDNSTSDFIDLNANELIQLVFTEGKSSKFWSIIVREKQHEVHYGRIGTNGQRKTKQFDSTDLALTNTKQLINQKLKKGYYHN